MKQREGQKTEFKLVWNDNAYKTACAFANTEGGKLYIGYDDEGKLVGIKRPKEDIENLPNSIRSKLNLYVSIFAGVEDGKEYLEVSIPAMDQPVFYDGKIYVRVGSTNQLLEGNDLINFILQKGNGSWDAVVVPNVKVEDLDDSSFKILLDDGIRNKRLTEYDRTISKQALLEKMSLMKDGKLTRAAILLFHPHPEYFFGGAHIKLGYFNANNELRYQDELYGSLLTLAKRAEELLVLKYFYATIDYDGMVRVETLPYPREAIREGILNALMHNNYMSAQPIAIRVSPYELWISNRCIFPNGWTEETLFSTHESIQINPNIAVGFFRAGLVERFGSGIQKIVNFCKDNGNPQPRYSIYLDMITLKIASRPANIQLAIGEGYSNEQKKFDGNEVKNGGSEIRTVGDNSKTVGDNSKTVGDNSKTVGDNSKTVGDNPNAHIHIGGSALGRKRYVLQEIIKDPFVTGSKLSQSTGLSSRTIDRYLSWLTNNGFIVRDGSDRCGHWVLLKTFEQE